MSEAITYTPAKVRRWDKANGGAYANVNRPIAGPSHDQELPVGRHPFQLYSMATPPASRSRSCSKICWTTS